MVIFLFFAFELLTRDQKKNSLRVTYSMGVLLFSYIRVKSVRFLYLACFAVSTYVIFIWVCWILMAHESSTAYLLTRLPHAGLYNHNDGRQVEHFYMK